MDMPGEAMFDEWQAWRQVCSELERRGVDINGTPRLHGAIIVWGEMLVALRLQQDTETVDGAREYAAGRWRCSLEEEKV